MTTTTRARVSAKKGVIVRETASLASKLIVELKCRTRVQLLETCERDGRTRAKICAVPKRRDAFLLRA